MTWVSPKIVRLFQFGITKKTIKDNIKIFFNFVSVHSLSLAEHLKKKKKNEH